MAKAASRRTRSQDERCSRRCFADLNRYESTTHFIRQSTVTIDGDHATGGELHDHLPLFSEDGNRKIMITAPRYLDAFATIDGS
jgi:hypothetical protein